ncbi:ribonuclease Z [Candidatus Woesearchaeota archaeon]|nr:ribonuclease Z [Candidatus Woesearchaeota archaeon]
MELIFLGTGAMMPTKDRNTAAIVLEFKGDYFLFDCGEGTQRQMRLAGLSLAKICRIFITHWHGDHVLGLPGLIQSLGASEYCKTLLIYGPSGSKTLFESMMSGTLFDFSVPVEYVEVRQGMIVDSEEYKVECAVMKHKVPCVGYSFIEKDRRRINLEYVRKLGIPDGPILGKLQNGQNVVWKGKKVSLEESTKIINGRKMSYITDTAPNKSAVVLAKNADVLVCESSFMSELQDKAEEYLHLTAVDAGRIAQLAGVKKLVLTHFSPRYTEIALIEAEAKTVFDKVVGAKDFMSVKI